MSNLRRIFGLRAIFTLLALFAFALVLPPTTGQAFAAGQAAHIFQRSAAHTVASRPLRGDILYQADWSKGMDGWAGSSDWKVSTEKAMLLNDGSASPCSAQPGPTIVAPYSVKIADYAVEAKIQILRYS